MRVLSGIQATPIVHIVHVYIRVPSLLEGGYVCVFVLWHAELSLPPNGNNSLLTQAQDNSGCVHSKQFTTNNWSFSVYRAFTTILKWGK